MHRTKLRHSFLDACLVAGLLGMVAMSAIVVLEARYSVANATASVRSAYNSVSTASVMKYGVVRSVDPETRSLSVDSQMTSGISLALAVTVPTGAYIARQELTGSADIYTALSPRVEAPLSDIRAGDRVALSLSYAPDGTLEARVVIFGNPL